MRNTYLPALLAATWVLMPGAALAQAEGSMLYGQDAYGGWENNRIGVTRLITVDDLPEPHATKSASNAPAVVARPDGAMPNVPEGFKVELVDTGIANPRAIRFAPNGDLFVANSSRGEVLVYRFDDGNATPSSKKTFVSGLSRPYGIAFYPSTDPQWVYIAESDGLRRYAYSNGDMSATSDGEILFKDIDPFHHWTRDVVFAPDGQTMYYSVGSGSNIGLGNTMQEEPEGGLENWVASHGLGVAWGKEEGRAAVLAMNPDGSDRRYYATGLRNCAGMTMQMQTSAVWCAVNERDGLGDNLPPDFVTSVEQGGFYGWPWFYIGDHPDPNWAGHAPAIGETTIIPDVLLQPHSAPLNLVFYNSDAFGADYENHAFAALHGSWNRGNRTGYKVVEVPIDENGKADGSYTDFMTGFITEDGDVWGRPVGVAVSPEGALFVSEDGAGSIWKVSKQ